MKRLVAPFRLSRVTLLAIFVPLVAVAYFFELDLPLLGPDEPRYAQVAREMWQAGDWITPTLGGHNWFEKPALLYWLQITFYNIFGGTEFAARIGSALFGLGTIASVAYMGRVLDRESDEKGYTAAFAVVAASTVGILAFSHGASFDIILTFPITAAMASFFAFSRRGSTGPLVLFYFFIGVAVLAKGLVGILFPLGIVAVFYLFGRRMPSAKLLLSLAWGTMLAAAVAAAWYVPMYLKHGYEFIDEFIIQHHFQRFTSNKYLHPQPFVFFFWMLPLLAIPWAPAALITAWQRVATALGRRPVEGSEAERSVVDLAAAWAIVPLLFFSFSGSKLPGYIMPAVPAMAVFAAVWVRRSALKSPTRGYAAIAVAAGTLAISIAVLIGYLPTFARGDSVKYLVAAASDAGYGDARVACLHTVSHNAEFYAAGRLIRTEEGKIRRFGWAGELADHMRDAGLARVVVLVPPQYAPELANETRLTSKFLGDNGELTIAAVSLAAGGTP